MWTEPIVNKNQNNYQNYNDYNRVEGNTEYINNQLDLLGYYYDVIIKTDWNENSIDTLQKVQKLVNNININKFFNIPGWIDLRTNFDVENPDYQDYNNWEKNLILIKRYIEAIKSNRLHAKFSAGNNRVRQYFQRG